MPATLTTPKAVRTSWFGGTGSLSGVTRDHNDVPASREVLVFDAWSHVLLARVMSGADGTYTVSDLKRGLVVDVRFRDADGAPVLNDKVHSRVVIG